MSRLPNMWATTNPIRPAPVKAITYLAPNDERSGLSNAFINTLRVDRSGGNLRERKRTVAEPASGRTALRFPALTFYTALSGGEEDWLSGSRPIGAYGRARCGAVAAVGGAR